VNKSKNILGIFTDRQVLDLNVPESIPAFFDQYQPQYFINCAAYTAVDKAETEQASCFLLNDHAPTYLSQLCEKYKIQLITGLYKIQLMI
jgi:dTDP-4-dehydrorhamnose reductase